MGNHFFTIGGKTYRQTDGGAIGSDLTGELARIVMLLWNEKFLAKLKDLNINPDVYKRYVDDIIMVLSKIVNKRFEKTLGCSGRSLHARLDDHIDDITASLEKNAMVKHFENVHPEYPWQTEVPSEQGRLNTTPVCFTE